MNPQQIRAIALTALTLASSAAVAAGEVGALLRQGRWHGDMVDFDPPAQFAQRKIASWPSDGWVALQLGKNDLTVSAQTAPAGKRPPFLQAIVDPKAKPVPGKALYLRAPAMDLKTGALPLQRFKDGRTGMVLVPGKRMETVYDSQTLAVSVTLKSLPPGGEGESHAATLVVEYGGKKYEYALGETTPDALRVTLAGAAALDGDGVPDLLLEVATGGQAYDAVILSKAARPGRNSLSATLQHIFD